MKNKLDWFPIAMFALLLISNLAQGLLVMGGQNRIIELKTELKTLREVYGLADATTEEAKH